MSSEKLKVGMISLGCAKNLVDAEIMLGSLLQSGVEVTNDPAEAEVLVINTCSFIDAAQEESVDTILQSAEVRGKSRPDQALVVSGCLPQRFREELPKLLPEVDAFMGIDQVARVGEIVREAYKRRRERGRKVQRSTSNFQRSKRVTRRLAELEEDRGNDKALPSSPMVEVAARPTYIPDYSTPRFRLTPRHFAYVKIAEGCNHPCSFCIIPRMRGSHRSRSQADVVAEARQLLAEGVKELNLISQDTTYYGLDLRPNRGGSISSPNNFKAAAASLPVETPTLCNLLRELSSLPGDFWIRLLYTHPAHWTDELIETIAECPKVARYVDMPLQHIHDDMLERMRRETSGQYIRDLIEKIRGGIRGIALRTTFIVGFPGETETHFETLLDFIRETKFERLGVFAYSQEEGTRAGRMERQIPDKIKKQRRDRAMAAQHKVAVEVSERYVGQKLKVLVEHKASAGELKQAKVLSWEHGFLREQDRAISKLKGRYLVARGEGDAPDIDGRIYIGGDAAAGEFATVHVIGHTDYDLIGEVQ